MNSHSADASRSQRKRLDAKTKLTGVVAAASSAQARVTDPDAPNIDRTPLPLSKPPQPVKGLGKRAAEQRPAGQTAESTRRLESVSQMGSTHSSDRVSGSTPDDSTTMGFEESSETRSTERSTFTKPSDMVSQVSSQQIGRAGAGAVADAEPSEIAPVVEQWGSRDKEEWLSSQIQVVLSTMPVVFHFAQEDSLVTKDTPQARTAAELNESYKIFCDKRMRDEGGSRFTDRGTTTFNDPKKSVQSLVRPPATRNVGSHVTTWKLDDEYRILHAEDDLDDAQVVEVEVEEAGDDDTDLREGDEEEVDAEEGSGVPKQSKSKGWLASESLLETVLVMERAVLQNSFEELQLAYRGIEMPELTDHIHREHTRILSGTRDRREVANARYGAMDFLDTAGDRKDEERRQKEERQKEADAAADAFSDRPAAHKGQLRELWKFSAPTSGVSSHVTCMAWNRVNTDLMAAGYGSTVTEDDKHGGVIRCWSLKNPIAPERVITLDTDAGVSSMSFSESHPSLLAVGMTDGTLALYDVRAHGNSPALKSAVNAGQHTGTVWDVRWIQKGKDRGEGLMSVSADGHVMEWAIKKGLERSADLMKLKRVPNQNSEGVSILGGGRGANPREALLSRQSGGMTFDVSPRDSIIYVVGTEDGTLHKCSKSQNENYILDYRPHEEPVYRLRWNPFNPNFFLTCSADWTSRLYHVDRADPVLRLDANNQDAVHDISWSPTRCTVFATGTSQGRIQIWDIADPLKEKASFEIKGESVSSVMFASQESPVVVAGDSRGDITVLKLLGSEFERNGLTDEEQERLFSDVVQKVAV